MPDNASEKIRELWIITQHPDLARDYATIAIVVIPCKMAIKDCTCMFAGRPCD